LALKQEVGSETRHYSTLAVPHVASSGPFHTQADVSVVYYTWTPTLEQTKAYDVSMVTFKLLSNGEKLCMMVSSHELPITPQQNLSACRGPDLEVSIPSSSREFCAPSSAFTSCTYTIGIRIEGSFPELKVGPVGVSLAYTEPLYRHLFLSPDINDHLQNVQRFKYVVPAGTAASHVTFNVYISPAQLASSRTELMVGMTGFPSGSQPQIGVIKAGLPNLEISFTKTQLQAFIFLYKNLTFYLTLVAPSIPETTEVGAPEFALTTRVLGDSGQPIPQPTAPPSLGWQGGGGSSQLSKTTSTSAILWVWTARFLGVLAGCLLLSCIINSVKYLCKSRDVRQAEALGDLLHQSKQNIDDAWSRAAVPAETERDVEMQQLGSI